MGTGRSLRYDDQRVMRSDAGEGLIRQGLLRTPHTRSTVEVRVGVGKWVIQGMRKRGFGKSLIFKEIGSGSKSNQKGIEKVISC